MPPYGAPELETASLVRKTGTLDVTKVKSLIIIDPSGKLIYDGAIDDRPTTDPSSVDKSHNYVTAALSQAMAGKSVATAYTRPYGCSVKYASESE